MSGQAAATRQGPQRPYEAPGGRRWCGVPSALTATAVGLVGLAGVDVVAEVVCPPDVPAWRWGKCDFVQWTLPLPWLLPVAVTAAALLLVPAPALTRRAGTRLSAWAWLGLAAIAVTAAAPVYIAAMQVHERYVDYVHSQRNVTITVVSGAAVSLAVLLGTAVLAERARPRSRRGTTTIAALGAVALLGAAAATSFSRQGLRWELVPVALAVSAVALVAATRLWHGRPRLARSVLYGTLSLAFVYFGLMLLALSIDVGSDLDAGQVVAEYGGLPAALTAIALTGLLAGVQPRDPGVPQG